MSADHLLDNKEGVIQEKVAAAARPQRHPGASGKWAKGVGDDCRQPKAKELKGL